MKKKILIALIPIILIGTASAFYMYNKPHKKVEKLKADWELDSEQLYAAYAEDEASADARYLGKVVEVSGVIEAIEGVHPNLSLTLSAGDEMFGVICQMDRVYAEHRSDFKVGENVTLKGYCTGYLMDVVVDRCVELGKE